MKLLSFLSAPLSVSMLIVTLVSLLRPCLQFTFSSITVQPQSKIINTQTRYKLTFDRTQDDNIQSTPYLTTPILPSDTVTVTFPTSYSLSSVSIACSVSVNGGTPFTPTGCSIVGNKVVVSGVVGSSTIVANVVLWVNGIVNPNPAVVTDYFYGTVGSDVSGVGTFASTVILQPATFLSCYVTFSPNIVNSTADMIISVIPQNSIGSSGSIVVQFPTNRRWTNDISSTNFMPISSSMSCSNKSSNIKSTFQCIGDTTQALITASNLFNSAISSSFSFSINSFLSPPTEQPSDPITITSYIGGSKIDTCQTYVSGLAPKPISGLSIGSSTGGAIVVNRQYLLRFTFTLLDTLSQTDTIVLNFPTGTQLAFSTSTVSSNFSIFPSNATYDSNNLNLNLYMQNQGRTFASGSVLIMTLGTYTAPVSTQPTSNFVLSVYRNGFIKMQGTTTLTASASTLSGTVIATSTSVNANTSYSFSLTTLDALSSSGKIKLSFPPSVSILTNSPTCASITGTNFSLSPICSFNSTQNSITLTSLNSSSSPLGAQSFTILISGIKNPPSISPTSSFTVSTYHKNTDASLVATGILSGITSTTAIIDAGKVAILPSSLVVNQQATTYGVQLTVSNPIPAGGYFLVTVPAEIGVLAANVPGKCSININSTSYVPTACTASGTTNVVINFTNPFSSDMTTNSVFIARISSIFTNPTSTRPTSSFGLNTFHSNGYQIANIASAIGTQMNTADSFQTRTVSRLSLKNYDLTTYTFTLKQTSPFEVSSILIITFPSNVVPNTPTCTMTSPSASVLGCTFSGTNLKIVLPSSSIAGGVNVVINVTNVRNPPSFAPLGTFTYQTKTPGELYMYSYATFSSGLANTVATPFQSLAFVFTPRNYGEAISLKIDFAPSNSEVAPTELKFTFANSFTIQEVSCNSFIDFVGTCTSLTSNTISVTGSFTTSPMSFSITGFSSPITSPTDYSSIVSFDSSGYKLDQSTNTILFSTSCTMPCRTCSPTSTTCTSCYSNTLITSFIYFDSTLSSCFQQCPDSKYQNTTSNLCLACDPNCLTCDLIPTFCTKCNSSSLYPYLLITLSPSSQKCVSICPSAMYPDYSINPTTCKSCVLPCLNCTSVTACTSCVSGFYYYQGQCLTNCPTGIAIANPGTNNCDFCDANCLTCANLTTTCTSCNQTLLLYQGKCRTSCPSPLVPQNGTCGACDSSCKTCSVNPYNCTSCDTASSLPYLYGNLCLADCPETYYKNLGAGACSLCSSVLNLNCRNCSSVSTCKTCDVGFVYYLQSCLNYVPTGFVNISGIAEACAGDCQTCSITTTNCTSCKTLNLYNYQCLSTCPSGYVAQLKQCTSCNSPCRTCSPTPDTCLSCLTTLSPSVFLSNSLCVQVCPNGTYGTRTNYTCTACQSPCSYCTSATVCVTCINGFYLQGSSCVTTCQNGYLGLDGVCKVCLGNCATCAGSVTSCTSCKSDYYFFPANSSCVTSCGTGLYVDYLARACVACTAPCKTCVNTSDTCLSCLTGVLFNNQCPSQCPDKYFIQSSQCNLCPTNCSSCVSLVNCTSCAQNFVLYNGFCITQCPQTHAVVISSICTKCSTSNCHKCSSADFCTACESAYSLHNGACLSTCPSGFASNGTHCLDTNQQILTSTVTFPIPFTIATIVIIIACLMSRLQFSTTFMPGALYSILGLVEVGALGYFLYLFFITLGEISTLPFYVGIAALGWIILLNILAVGVQNWFLCYDKDFSTWYQPKLHKISTIIINIISTILCHKFRNILFSKLFSFTIFSAKLQSTQKFKVFNVFSFLSLLHSGAAIFAAAVAVQSATASTQIFYACIDVIVVTALNVVMGFFNIMKSYNYFYERTPQGFDLKKRINADEDYFQSKIQPAGKGVQDEEGFTTNIYRVQGGTGFTTNQAFKIREDGFQKDYSFGSLVDKNVQQISVQALQPLNEKQVDEPNNQSFSVVFARNTNKSGFLPKQSKFSSAEISIQSSPLIEKGSQQRLYNKQVKQKQFQRSPQRTVFYKDQTYIPYQSQPSQQKLNEVTKKTSKSKQKQKKKIFDSSASASDLSPERQKNILYKPNLQSKFSRNSQPQPEPEPLQQYQQFKQVSVGGVRPIDLDLKRKRDQSIQSNTKTGLKDQNVQQGISKAIGTGTAKLNTFYQSQQQIHEQPIDNVIFQQDNENQQTKLQNRNKNRQQTQNQTQTNNLPKGLKQTTKDQLILPKQQIEQYEKQLQERINQKKQKIQEMKRNINNKQKINDRIKGNANGGVQAGKLYKKNKDKVGQENQKIGQYIWVVDQNGRKKRIKVQFNQDRLEEKSEQDYNNMLSNQKNQIIYQQQQLQTKLKQSSQPQPQPPSQIPEILPNVEQSPQKITLPIQAMNKQFSGGETSGNETSTKIYSTTFNQNQQNNKNSESNMGMGVDLKNVDQMEKSIDEEEDQGIIERPVGRVIGGLQTDLSDALPEIDSGWKRNMVQRKKGKEQGQYSQRLDKNLEGQDGQKGLQKKKFDGRNSSPLKPQHSIDSQPQQRKFSTINQMSNTAKTNHLKIKNRFQFQQQEKNMSQSGEDDHFQRFNFNRAHLIAPFQTDKEQTQFRNSGTKSPQKILVPRHSTIPVSSRSKQKSSHRQSPQKPNWQSQSSSFSPQKPHKNPILIQKQQAPNSPGSRSQSNSSQIEPQIEQNSMDTNSMRPTPQIPPDLASRPDNDELKKYYEENRRRKEEISKDKKRASRKEIETEKIYLHKQDTRKWK